VSREPVARLLLTAAVCHESRVKVVSPQYSALSRLSWWSGDDAALRLLLLEVVRANDHDAFIKRYPQW
jgi:hypothetical protein